MRLHFREQGHGPALIILHGLFGSLENWAYVSGQLAGRFRIFSVDLRNHGQSPHDPEMNYSVMAEDLREFLRERDLPGAHVLGHSLGGKVAMQLALRNPELVERLVVVDMAPRAYRPAHATIFEALRSLDLRAFETRAQIEEVLADRIPELATRRFLLKGLGRKTDGTFAWKFNLATLDQSYPALNAAVTSDQPFVKPALFVRGEKSDYIREADQVEIRRLFPAATIVTIPGASHWVHAEAPQIFLTGLKNFFDTKD